MTIFRCDAFDGHRGLYHALAVGGLAASAISLIPSARATPALAASEACSAEALAVPLDDAASALAEQRPGDAAALLRGTLGACPPDARVPAAYYARVRIAALAALASHRAGDSASCRAIVGSDKGLRYLHGAAAPEELDEITAAALDSAPKDALALLFQAVALCPGEQRACAEPSWSNTRQRAGQYLKQDDYDGALAIYFEAFARCAADPLDDQAYGPYAWAVSDAAFTARKAGNILACRDLLRRDPGLRYVLGEATGAKADIAAEFVPRANALSAKLKQALRHNAKQCR